MSDYEEDEDFPALIRWRGVETIPWRGRESLPESQAFREAAFTAADLDDLAPLTDTERESLQYNRPTPDADTALQKRLEAAKRIKYGRDK